MGEKEKIKKEDERTSIAIEQLARLFLQQVLLKQNEKREKAESIQHTA